jgi:hypothetical protein
MVISDEADRRGEQTKLISDMNFVTTRRFSTWQIA